MITTETQINTAMTIRRVDRTDADAAQLAELAERDTRQVPEGPVLGAEVDGRLVAAISLTTGELIADPFRPTSELQALLRLRASQLRARPASPARRAPDRARPPPAGGRWLARGPDHQPPPPRPLGGATPAEFHPDHP